MKAIMIPLGYVIPILFFTSSVLAQDTVKNVLKLNPISLCLETVNFQFEKVVCKKQSVQIGFSYTNINYNPTDDDEVTQGYIVTIEFRNYISHKIAPCGFYLAPFFRNYNFKENSTPGPDEVPPTSGMMNACGGGAVLGYQGIGKMFSVDMFVGPAYYYLIHGGGVSGNISYQGFNIRLGLVLGVAF